MIDRYAPPVRSWSNTAQGMSRLRRGSAADDFVSATADVKIGVIVTSGVDGIYPKGFVIGKVAEVDNGNGIYKAIRVRPSVEFNTLEEVLVVKRPAAQGARDEGHS